MDNFGVTLSLFNSALSLINGDSLQGCKSLPSLQMLPQGDTLEQFGGSLQFDPLIGVILESFDEELHEQLRSLRQFILDVVGILHHVLRSQVLHYQVYVELRGAYLQDVICYGVEDLVGSQHVPFVEERVDSEVHLEDEDSEGPYVHRIVVGVVEDTVIQYLWG